MVPTPTFNMTILIILAAVLSLSVLSLPDSYQEVAYRPNSPFYNLIYSEKFPPQLETFKTKKINKTKSFSLPSNSLASKKVKILKPEFPLTYEDKRSEEPSRLQQFKQIITNLRLAFNDFVDVNLIRAFVDLGFDGMSPQKRLPQNKGRVGVGAIPKENETLRRAITFLLGGVLGKQDCASRTLCEMGRLIEPLKGKSLIFMIFDTVLPKQWKHVRASIDVFEKGTQRNMNCHSYTCEEIRHSN